MPSRHRLRWDGRTTGPTGDPCWNQPEPRAARPHEQPATAVRDGPAGTSDAAGDGGGGGRP